MGRIANGCEVSISGPADCPKNPYETVLNLKAAKALGLRALSILLAAADEVIE